MVNSESKLPSVKATLLRTLLITSILISAILYDKAIRSKPSHLTVYHQAFRFHVHCPITTSKDGSFLHLMEYLGISNEDHQKKIFQQVLKTQTYVVFMKAFATDPNDITNSSVLMSYCGFARLKNETDCSNAQLLCTTPGPMFIVPVNQKINVIWINQINGTGLNWTEVDQNCYGSNSNDTHCTVAAKSIDSNPDCTFYQPTIPMTSGVKSVRVSSKAIPISPHIHGLQTRPTFDGGPFNWFNNIGDKGPGYFSLSTNNYYNSFFKEQTTFLKNLLTSEQANMIKVNQYRGDQPPGMLFYHDHAMKAALTNNIRGSQGFYIIYDPEQEKIMPTNEEEYLFVFHFFNQGDLRIKQDRRYLGEGKEYPFIGPIQDNTFLYGKQYVYRNMTYRWKLLNSHFDTTYSNISFTTFYRQLKDSKGYLYTQELEPPLDCNNDSFFKNGHKINFTVIGTDSATLSKAVHNIDQIRLGAAERIQILIKYDSVPENVSHIYVVAYDNLDDEPRYVVKLDLTLLPDPVANKYKQPAQFNDLSINFTNLSSIPSTSIAKQRMRALISRPFQGLFTINQHAQFTKAASQNPQIGTIQDWYIINTMKQLHPMHFHVVNFQMVKSYSLKVIAEGCSLYELDFFRQSNISIFQIENNTQLCSLLKNITYDQIIALSDQFNNYNLENQFINGISGKNVMELVDKQSNSSIYFSEDCPLNQFKYVCKQTTDQIPQYEKGWKDTGKVQGLHVVVLRVRWAKVKYDPTVKNSEYFAYDEAEMLQWPGFLYHCHMLMHAQKMMMRPIVFQPSERFKANHQKDLYDCNHLTWYDRYKCINLALQCNF